MKTKDVLLDLQFSIGGARREPTIENIIAPNHLVIEGVKFTAVFKFEFDQCSVHFWNEHITSVQEFFIFDPDNYPIQVDPDLMREWIDKHILFKNVDEFGKAHYKDAQDWQMNSPLVKLELCEA
jgi:hypothetical protein